MLKPIVSIILPTYNESEGIIQFLLKLQAVMFEWAEIEKCSPQELVEVIVVDDNSPDGTAELVREFSKIWKEVKLVVRTTDRGLGKSILAGIQASHGQVIVGMDADNNHDPLQIPVLVAVLQDADLVVASRFIRGGGIHQPLRWLATWLFNLGLKLLGFPVWDNFSGYYAVSKKALQNLGLERIYYGYGDYHLRLVFFAAEQGLKIKEIPTTYLERLGGQSKSQLGKMAIDYAREAIRLRFTRLR